jgi:hypothetical protein
MNGKNQNANVKINVWTDEQLNYYLNGLDRFRPGDTFRTIFDETCLVISTTKLGIDASKNVLLVIDPKERRFYSELKTLQGLSNSIKNLGNSMNNVTLVVKKFIKEANVSITTAKT